ncbi:DsbA family protein [Paracoccaceae bacterium GXU_MW_L88]
MNKLVLMGGVAVAAVAAVLVLNKEEEPVLATASDSQVVEEVAPIDAQAETDGDEADTGAEAESAAADAEPTIPVGDMVLGDEAAPVTVIEYASFTCPHCANYATQVYPDIKADYIDSGQVKYIKREVYFDQGGLWAGLVARCAGETRYFATADMLYRKQKDWAQAGSAQELVQNLRDFGNSVGLNEEQVNACLSDEAAMRALVTAYQTNSEEDGINSTPSFVINGEKLEGGYPALSDALAEAVENAS